MKCARLRLHERSKPRATGARAAGSGSERPRRFCQQRLVDPAHHQDPRWTDLLDRFYCNSTGDAGSVDNIQTQPDDDLFLSVQNIKFDGDVNERKRPKTCFKYKAMSDGKKHRMFVKQVVEENEEYGDDCSSQLTCYYFDDYVKYILNPEQSVPSEKSSILLCAHGNHNKLHKIVQAKPKEVFNLKKSCQFNIDAPNNCSVKGLKAVQEEPPDLSSQDTKIAYHKSGKRKCLTISRAASPETVQVIRVDVVCHGRSGGAGAGDAPAPAPAPGGGARTPHLDNKASNHSKMNVNMKTNHFSNKYLLTNTTKTLEESVSGGAKVTLLCKTFRLSSRNKPNNEKSTVKT